MVGMKNYLSCRFTDIRPWTPHSHALVEVKISDYNLPCIYYCQYSSVNWLNGGV